METALLHLKEECNFERIPKFIRYLHGGDINSVYLIEADGRLLVVKQNEALKFPEMFAKEFRAMLFLREKSVLYYPEVFQYFTTDKHQFLVMEYVEAGKNTSSSQQRLGQGLAKQHQISNTQFGWNEDNYMGSLKQVNTHNHNWNSFFAENRLLFQTEIAFDAGLLTSRDVHQIEQLCQRLNEIIPEEKPALLHGDLWGGNYFVSIQNEPIIYDPAVYFGHREIDLAMTQLFGGFSSDFFAAYQEEYPLEKDWEQRVALFQLYPNLVHLNLFGNAYASSIRAVIDAF